MNKNKILIIIGIILSLCIIGFCTYLLVDKGNNVKKEEQQNNKQTNMKKETSSEDSRSGKTQLIKTDTTNADINKDLIHNLYDNKVIGSLSLTEANQTNIDFILDYGKINNHDVKIRVYNQKSGTSTPLGQPIYKQVLDVYVDDNMYNLLDVELVNNVIGEFFVKFKVKFNKMGIIFINNINSYKIDQLTSPFILIYNMNNKFEFIDENLVNQYVRTMKSKYYNEDYEEYCYIEVQNDSITYCVYDNNAEEKANSHIAKIRKIKYDGVNKTVIGIEFEAVIDVMFR